MVFSRIKQHHVNAAIYLSVSVLTKGASLLLVPLYTNRLTRAEYAAYGLCQTLYWIVPTLATVALSSALLRFFFDHKDPEKRDRTFGGIASGIVILAIGWG